MYFVKHYAWFYCGTVILVPFLLWGGITSNEVSFSIKRTEEINSWGFIHPNDYSIFAFHALCTLYILWYRKKIFFYLVSLPTMFFIMKSTGARTYTYSIFLLPLFELFPLKVRSWCSKHFYIIAAFYLSTSFLLLWFHDTKLDQILSTRLSCQYNALNLFPQNCYLLGMNNARYLTFLENATDTGIKLIVDSSAIRLFFTKGLFALVCVVFLYGKLASRYPDVFNKYFPLICVGLLSGLFSG